MSGTASLTESRYKACAARKKIAKWLCRMGWHKWKIAGLDLIPTGAYVACVRCGKHGYQSWV